ncbi:DNA polymerase epsilon subunit 4 [Plakobranchus ocellatus]|uniref:DNA polymerase epsilon subunit 4 n=1 Tax=Plakobranchus ocellatus TaxID=259542 RepID=A0AAV4D719_9GAST|nr:DNA polymerase epsilon subunit 4 [Plakobranchus ocellatus]
MAGSEIEAELDKSQDKKNETEIRLTEEKDQAAESDQAQREFRSESEPQEKLIKLPLTRIRSIMKTDPDVKIASHDAVVILAKAAELFIQNLSREAAEKTLRDKRKTVSRKHLDDVLDARDKYAFLEGVIESFED